MIDEQQHAAAGSNGQDLVVIDRTILKQTLSAVIATLQSSANLELIKGQDAVDEEGYAQLRNELNEARSRLVAGIEQMVSSIDDLPRVSIRPEQPKKD